MVSCQESSFDFPDEREEQGKGQERGEEKIQRQAAGLRPGDPGRKLAIQRRSFKFSSEYLRNPRSKVTN